MKKWNRTNQNDQTESLLKKISRNGSIIIMIVVGLVVTAMISGTMIRQTITNEKQTHLEFHRIQAQWLAEAGIERAAWQLRKDESYQGETWKISESDLEQNESGEIQIHISDDSQKENNKILTVTATYPYGSTYRAVQSKTILFSLNKPTE